MHMRTFPIRKGALCLLASLLVHVASAQIPRSAVAPSPIDVGLTLEKGALRVGEPLVIQLQMVNRSHSLPRVVMGPAQGETWMRLRLRDSRGNTIGEATLQDFAGENTVFDHVITKPALLMTTRLRLSVEHYVTTGSAPLVPARRGGVFVENYVLGPARLHSPASATPPAFAPGAYTLTADVVLFVAADAPNALQPEQPPVWGGPGPDDPFRLRDVSVRGTRAGLVTGSAATSLSPPIRSGESGPLVPRAGWRLQRSFTLPLVIRVEPAAFRAETEDLAARLRAAYDVTTESKYGTLHRLPPDKASAGYRDTLRKLFNRTGAVARTAQLSVADAVVAAAAAGDRSDLAAFYRYVAACGTFEAIDFLADQAWRLSRPSALEALALVASYGDMEARNRVRELFKEHHTGRFEVGPIADAD